MFKYNLNKLHYSLNEKYSVEVVEKSDKSRGEYIELVIENEGVKCDVIITKRNLDGNVIKWSYFSNPDNGDFLIERTSTIETFTKDITDIFENNRFSTEYLNKK